MESIFNDIFSHVVKSEVAQLTSLSDFIYLTQNDNPVSNTPEFLKLMLTLETVVKTTSHLIKVTRLTEKQACDKVEKKREEYFISSSDESDSGVTRLWPSSSDSDSNEEVKDCPQSRSSSHTSRTNGVLFDKFGENIMKRLNRIFIDFFTDSATINAIVSQAENVYKVVNHSKRGPYVFYFNPLDSIYNAYYGTTCGSIFAFIKRSEYVDKLSVAENQVLLPGDFIDCAGYVLYGCSTILAIGIRNGGVHQFTLDSNLGLFVLTESNIKVPLKGKTYTIDEATSLTGNKVVSMYIDREKKTQETFNYYQPGSIVSALHYILIEGGIYIDPATDYHENGQTPILSSANPIAFLMKESGGKCFNGINLQDILNLFPESLHQTTPIFFGSNEKVNLLKEMFCQYSENNIL